MKKFFIGLGIFFVLAGIVFCVADTKDTSARAQALYDAPVVTMQDLEEWKNQDTQQEVVVTADSTDRRIWFPIRESFWMGSFII